MLLFICSKLICDNKKILKCNEFVSYYTKHIGDVMVSMLDFYSAIAHWNNSLRIDILPTLKNYPTSEPTNLYSFSLMLRAKWRSNKYQFQSLVWPDQGLNPRSTALEASMLTITPPTQYISVMSWLSVLLVEETGVLVENHWPVASHWQTLSHNVVSSTLRHEWDLNWKL